MEGRGRRNKGHLKWGVYTIINENIRSIVFSKTFFWGGWGSNFVSPYVCYEKKRLSKSLNPSKGKPYPFNLVSKGKCISVHSRPCPCALAWIFYVRQTKCAAYEPSGRTIFRRLMYEFPEIFSSSMFRHISVI